MYNSTNDTKIYEAFEIINDLFNQHYDEVVDALYYYTKSYIDGYFMDVCMFQDEIENLLGIREHDDIINYILGGGE